ncbi:MAG: hypothetical protein AAB433_19825 [Nitrospirota bacterium]
MLLLHTRFYRFTLISFAMIVTLIAGSSELAVALDPLPRSPRVGSLRIPLLSYNRVLISKLLSDPASYHLREVRIAGTVRIIQTRVMTQGCGVPYELTTLSLEDESGLVDVFDRGACVRNRSMVRAPMLAVGDRIGLLVHVTGGTKIDESEVSPEVFVLWIDRAQE